MIAGSDHSSGSSGSGPRRRDAGRREPAPARDMIRFVVDPGGRVWPDIANKLPGRGIWLRADRASLEDARRRAIFAREARRPVVVDQALAETVADLLNDRLLELVSLARRAGQLVAGFDKVKAELDQAADGVLLQARDAGGEAGRLRALLDGRPFIAAFDRFELGRRIGREQTVHAWLHAGRLADRVMLEAARLRGFREFEMAAGVRAQAANEGMSQAQ